MVNATSFDMQVNPFPHQVFDNVFSRQLVSQASQQWPGPRWPHWFTYEGPFENEKRTCKDWNKMPPAIQKLLRLMLIKVHPPVRHVSEPDDLLHGAGMHDLAPGTQLDLHLDCDQHPLTRKIRDWNAILFLDNFESNWGGELELWDAARKHPVVSILPKRNQLVLFETSDVSFHQVNKVLGPLHRKTLTIYFWRSQTSFDIVKRPRARYYAKEGVQDGLDSLRQRRGEL